MLREFVTRFNQETLYVDELDHRVAVAAFIARVKTPKFLFSLAKEALKDMATLILRAQKYMNAEDVTKARRGESSRWGRRGKIVEKIEGKSRIRERKPKGSP